MSQASRQPDESREALLRRLGAVWFRRAADTSLRFLEVDGPCAERMGLSQANLTGDAYSFWTRVDPEDRRRVLTALEDAIRKQSSYRVAYRLDPGDGRARFVREEGVAVVDEDGEVLYLDGIVLEAVDGASSAPADSRRVELRDFEDFFHAVADQSSRMIAELSADGLVSWANRRLCAALGRSEAELQACNPLDLVHADDQEHVLAAAREVKASGGSGEVLCRLQHADGSWLWVELQGQPMRSSSEALRGVVTGRIVEDRLSVDDVLQRQRLAEARIGKLSRRFIELGSEGLDEAIREAVEAAGSVAGADRCYLLAFPSERIQGMRHWVWQREGYEPWEPNPSAARGIRSTSPRISWSRIQPFRLAR